MQRSIFLAIAGTFIIAGCGKEESKPPVVVVINQQGQNDPKQPNGTQPKSEANPLPSIDVPVKPLTAQEKYDSAVARAFRHLSEKNEAEALAALQEAQAAQDTDFIKSEIERLKARQARAAAAEQTAQDIQAVLNAGRAAEAAKLCVAALEQFGEGDAAANLMKLKRQADALCAAQGTKQKYLEDAEAARAAKNYRAAILAFDQAAANGIDVTDLKPNYEGLRNRLDRYDEQRARAAELRRDPGKLEDAIAALEAARQEWDTPQVVQEIDEAKIALANRRDRLAVADFEVIGDVGMPLAGRTIAEEMLPHFKGRFDLVERSQFGALLQDLKIEAGDLQTNERGRSELCRLAKARYLVVGSVSRLYGVSVNARLVDAQCGLIVQTAKIVAATPEELVGKLPALARILQMTDEQKIAYEQEIAKAATIEPPAPAPLPPPPAAPAVDVSVAPIIVFTPRPPVLGPIVVDDFRRIPPPAPQPLAVVFVEAAPWRDRALFVSVELGDNLFRRGRFREAQRQFEFALTLAPGREEVRLRIDNCRPFVPPPPAVIVPPRPRLAVLPFAEIGTPGFVPLGTGAWAADALAPYFYPAYDIIDRGEVFWWMGRLGLTLRDVVTDPSARLGLARAMGVRYFFTGYLQETASFDAVTQIIDAEFNSLVGSGAIHVHSPYEMKLRLGELANLTLLPPAQREVFVQQTVVVERRVQEAQIHIGKGKWSLAIGIYREVLETRPNAIDVRFALLEAERRQRQWEIEEARRIAFEQEQARIRAEQERQAALAAEAERQRRAALSIEVDVNLLGKHRQEAQVSLLFQARNAAKGGNFALAINLFEGAGNFNRTPELNQELAAARAQAAEAERIRIVQEQAAREAAMRQQRERELDVARQALEAEQQRQAEVESVRRATEKAQADAAYQRLLDQAQQAQAKAQYDVAVSALQTARTLRPSAEIDQMISSALIDQARADAAKKGDDEKRKLETQLAAERERRVKAEQEAASNKAKYEAAMKQARAALAEKRYDEAKSQFQIASLTLRTDDAVQGLRQADDEIAKAKAVTDAARQAREAQQKKDADVARLIGEARAAAAAKQFDKAIQGLNAAISLKPGSVEAQAELVKTQQARDDYAAQARRDAAAANAAKNNSARFAQAIDRARAAIKLNKFDDAAQAIADARTIDPSNAEFKKVQQELTDARSAFAANQKMRDEEMRKQQIAGAADAARKAILAKQYDEADKAVADLRRLSPIDPQIVSLTQQIADGRKAMAASAEAAKRQAAYDAAMKSGQTALDAKKYTEAAQQFTLALQNKPNDPNATQLLATARAAALADAEAAKRKMDYTDAMTRGKSLMASKQYAQAADAFAAALKFEPNDPAATQGLNEAKLAQVPPKKDPPKTDPAKAAYDQHMAAARAAFAMKKYADAMNEAAAAYSAIKDPEAAKLYNDAKALLTPAKVDPPKKDPPKVDPPKKDPPKADPQAHLNQLLRDAAAAESQGHYADALKDYQEAQKSVPNNADVKKKIDFCKGMAEGQKDLQMGRFAEAAAAIDQCLKLYPNDANAKKYLQLAREKKKM
jgi:tetratricopeptide (TPR) repeat protein